MVVGRVDGILRVERAKDGDVWGRTIKRGRRFLGWG